MLCDSQIRESQVSKEATREKFDRAFPPVWDFSFFVFSISVG